MSSLVAPRGPQLFQTLATWLLTQRPPLKAQDLVSVVSPLSCPLPAVLAG